MMRNVSDFAKNGVSIVSWRLLKICALGILLLGLARAATNAPSELLLKLQEEIQQGNLDSARSQLAVAIKQFPSDPGLYNLLGIVDAQQGKRAAAEADFRKAVKGSPKFTGALLNLGRLYMEQAANDPNASRHALDVYQKILSYDPTNAEALYQSAVLLTSAGSYQNSLNHLNRLPPDVQERAQVLAIRCADHAGLNQTALAASTAEKLLQSPDLSQADVMSVLPHAEAHDEALAVRLMEGLTERKLAGREALWWLGSYYQRQGKLPRARETLEQAEQTGAPSVEILSELARVAYEQHDRDGALGYLAHARDLDPNNAGIHFFFGVVCIELNLPIEARKSLDEAVRLDPENAYYNYALGAVAVNGRDPTQAIPYFEKYIQRKPDDPRGRFALGAAYFYLANYEAAVKNLRAVEDRPETAPGAHYFLGRIAKLQDNLPEAESELKKAVAADPRFVDALAELAQVHIKLERYDDAANELQRAFELDPGNFRVNANLLVLYQKTKDPRASDQQVRFDEIKKKRDEDEQLLWRAVVVQPN
jgi:tetratricopeptide (TPR) repeat protein